MRDVPDQFSAGAKQLVAYGVYHTFTVLKPALYTLSVGLTFEVEAT
jgi:hypothetical protein